jgi:hypothetical protein
MKRSSILGALAVAGAAAAARPALAANSSQMGPPAHTEGPRVFARYDQVELDAAYDQSFYAPLQAQIQARRAANSKLVLARMGDRIRIAARATTQSTPKPVQLIEATSYNHFEVEESLGNPYGPKGRAALAFVNA